MASYLDVDGTDRRRLTTNPFENASDTDPNISPDGQTITFVRLKVEHELQALFAVDIDGTQPAETDPVQAGGGREARLGAQRAPYRDHPLRRPPEGSIASGGDDPARWLPSADTHAGWCEPGSVDGLVLAGREVDRLPARELGPREEFRLFKIHPDGTGRTFIKEFPFSPFFIDWGSQSQS